MGIALRAVIDLAIWFGIVVVPLLGPVVLVFGLVSRWMKGRSSKQA